MKEFSQFSDFEHTNLLFVSAVKRCWISCLHFFQRFVGESTLELGVEMYHWIFASRKKQKKKHRLEFTRPV